MPKGRATQYSNMSSWQIDWMNKFAESRQELNYKIGEEKFVNSQKQLRINQLQNELTDEKTKLTVFKEKVKIHNRQIKEKYEAYKDVAARKYQKLKTKLTERDQTIKQLTERCATFQSRTSENETNDTDQKCEITPLSEMNVDMTDTEENSEPPNDTSQKCEFTPSSEMNVEINNQPLNVRSQCVMSEHSYTLIDTMDHRTVFYQCANCDFLTKKKSSYDCHTTEFCSNVPNRDIECPICHKMFTYLRLRNHLNHYAPGRHKPRKEHAQFTPLDHRIFLDTLIANIKPED